MLPPRERIHANGKHHQLQNSTDTRSWRARGPSGSVANGPILSFLGIGQVSAQIFLSDHTFKITMDATSTSTSTTRKRRSTPDLKQHDSIWGSDVPEEFKLWTDRQKVTHALFPWVGVGKHTLRIETLNYRFGLFLNASCKIDDQQDQEIDALRIAYETHKIKKDAGQFYPFVFSDLMGLPVGSGEGVRVEDIKLAMMGHVKEGYKFNPASPLSTSDSGYNPSPSPEDRVHVLVCVYAGNMIGMNSSMLQKMKAIRETASDLGIPQLAVVTKFDEACPETAKDLKNMYKSKFVKNKIRELSSGLGISLNFILPVKNYSEETQLNDDIDASILRALRMMIDLGEDFIDAKL
ncbi:unnamed protein product [Oreochromis niloticus]|nr:unnamed protein product [Mustela putorius furo]